jgi:hypothetical protein
LDNYYKILGVSIEASPEEIEKVYHKLSLKYHPDVCDGCSDEKFKKINEANGILSDEEKRREYDQNFAELFHQKRNSNVDEKLHIIKYVHITILEAKKGTKKNIKINRVVIHANKKISEVETITVTIPPNIKANTKLRIKWKGNDDYWGKGHLDIIIRIKENDNNSNLKKKYPNIDEWIINNFPFETPRDWQLETIAKINDAIEKGYKYIILEAGTGTGKSVMGATLLRMYETGYVFTTTKQLQEQYLNNFREYGFSSVKGRPNFYCKNKINDNIKKQHGIEINNWDTEEWKNKINNSDKYLKCNFGYCTSFKVDCDYALKKVENKGNAYGLMSWIGNNHCDYLDQKVNGINGNITIMNYSYALTIFNHTKDFEKREMIIFDEAHSLEKEIMNFLSLKISAKTLNDIGSEVSEKTMKYSNEHGLTAWTDFFYGLINKYTNKLKYQKEKNEKKMIEDERKKMNEDERKKIQIIEDEIKKYKGFINHCC